MSVFQERLRSRTTELGMSWSDLSQKTGLSTARISQYNTGLYIPKPDALYLLADALNVNPEWLIGKSDIEVPYSQIQSYHNILYFDSLLMHRYHNADDKIKRAILDLLEINDMEVLNGHQ